MSISPVEDEKIIGLIIGERYSLVQKIGNGAFGVVYLGKDIKTGEKVAVKLELANEANAEKCSLTHENKVYDALHEGTDISCVPHKRWFGQQGEYRALVMDLLGPSLQEMFNRCGRKFTLKTTLMLAIQMLDAIEYIHGKNYIHRDLKPANLLMGTGFKRLFFVDYGLAKMIFDPVNQEHNKLKVNKKYMIGNALYGSVNVHNRIELSRRDELESIGYILMYFYKGSLPWQGVTAKTKRQLFEKIYEIKSTTPLEDLCKGLPSEFLAYLHYCRGLRFEETPSYSQLRVMFYRLLHRSNYELDFEFDWLKLMEPQN